MAMVAQAMAMAVAMAVAMVAMVALVAMVMAAAAHCAVDDTGLMDSTQDIMQILSLPNQKGFQVFPYQELTNVFTNYNFRTKHRVLCYLHHTL